MFEIVEAATLVEAADVMRNAEGYVKYLGGGTALVLLMKMGLVTADTLISLRRIGDVAGWREIAVAGDRLRIGGGMSIDRIARSPLVRDYAPGLAAATGAVGNVRIRNAATVGGLLAEADYASDPPAVLVSLNADVVVSDGRRTRVIPMVEFAEDFFTTSLTDEEVVIGVTVPITVSSRSSRYRKFCARSAEDRPCVGTAIAGEIVADTIADLRVVVGAVAGKPQWLGQITDPYRGRRLTRKVVDEIADAYATAIDPIEDVRGSSWYRRQVIRAEIARGLLDLMDDGASSRPDPS